MVNIDRCHDYSYKNTAKEQEQPFDKELFLEVVQKYRCLCMYCGHNIRNKARKQIRGRK